MKLLRTCSTAALAFALAGFATPAQAGSINCPTLGQGGATRQFTLTIANPLTASCLAFGDGNLNGNNDAVNQLGYTTIDATDTNTPHVGGNGELSVNGSNWSFTPVASFHRFVVAFKVGNNESPDWAAFLIPAGVTFGTWSTLPVQGGGFSHGLLYGQACGPSGPPCDPSDVPEPTTLALLGLGLLGAGLARRRKR